MSIRVGWVGLVVLFLSIMSVSAARADTIDLSVRIIDEKGAPHAGMPVRIVFGTEPDARGANAGAQLTTDADGRVSRALEAAVERRWSTGDYFIPRRLDMLLVGVELDLVGRRALYWVTLTDYERRGAVIGIETFIQGRNGSFDAALRSVPPASWQFPDQPGGLLMSDIGVTARSWNLESDTPADGRRRWRVTLELTKQAFTRR
jgi:hypothetical protein